VLDRWVRPYAGQVRLADLGTRRVAEWRSLIVAKGCASTQANHALSVLSAALGSAVANGELPSNPCARVKRIPVRVRRPRVLSPLEVETGIAAMRMHDRVLVELLCYGGLRPGEALALRWEDVRDGLLIIDRSYSYGELKDTNTHQRRTVDLVAPLAEDLAALRPAWPARDALVVANASGGFVDLHNWRRRVWKRAFSESSPYDGRHSLASLLLHEGGASPTSRPRSATQPQRRRCGTTATSTRKPSSEPPFRWSTRLSPRGGVCAKCA
jgi:integrase